MALVSSSLVQLLESMVRLKVSFFFILPPTIASYCIVRFLCYKLEQAVEYKRNRCKVSGFAQLYPINEMAQITTNNIVVFARNTFFVVELKNANENSKMLIKKEILFWFGFVRRTCSYLKAWLLLKKCSFAYFRLQSQAFLTFLSMVKAEVYSGRRKGVAVSSFCYIKLYTVNKIARSANSTVMTIGWVSLVSHRVP